MKLENKVFGKVSLVPPDNPSNANVRKTELVTGCVDRNNTRKAEVPRKFRLRTCV